MTLKLCQQKESRNWYIRGSYQGERVFKSLGTSDRGVAQAIFDNHYAHVAAIPRAPKWRAIPSLVGFEASSAGDIRHGVYRQYPQHTRKDGYKHISVTREGKTRQYPVHRLICTVFHGDPPEGAMALHKNNIKTDNRAVNLYWGNHSQNAYDLKHGNSPSVKFPSGRVMEFDASQFTLTVAGGIIRLIPKP